MQLQMSCFGPPHTSEAVMGRDLRKNHIENGTHSIQMTCASNRESVMQVLCFTLHAIGDVCTDPC